MNQEVTDYPSLDRIQAVAEQLGDRVRYTPVWHWQAGAVPEQMSGTELWAKLELLQHTGTFKARGALNNVDALTADEKRRGVVGVSAGNHAIALAWAAAQAGTNARVVMPDYANPARIEICRELQADVILEPDVHAAFARCQHIVDTEQRVLVHPFEGARTAEGTATVGLEFMTQVPGLEAVIVPVGGGGLLAGVAAAVKQINPDCAVYGVEPEGANALSRSLASGKAEKLVQVDTIADSLGAPLAMPYSLGVCQRFVDDMVTVSDDDLCQSMWHLFRDLKLVSEPATAAATAGLLGPLRTRLTGRKTGLVLCGANTDVETFYRHLKRGQVQV